MSMTYKQTCADIFKTADIEINGNRAWDMQVHNNQIYQRILSQGSLGLGESFMDGWWDCLALDQFFDRVISADLAGKVKEKGVFWNILKAKLSNPQSIRKSRQVGEKHYDLGLVYQAMLDKRMVYSCGYWKEIKTGNLIYNLDDAQESKLELTCQKIGLQPGMSVLDIGCGWGSFLKYAAEKYQTQGLGVTISKEQVALGNQLCKGLSVKLGLEDYRDVNGQFDAIVSLGMFEHVGQKNYRTYMQKVSDCLKEDGLFLLHTIGRNNSAKSGQGDSWIEKYIFPGGALPSTKQITDSAEELFVLEDWHNFSADYDKTLMAWNQNFQQNWNKLKPHYGDRFKRMWEYYLLSCAGAFRSRNNQLWQIVFSKNGVRDGYQSVR